MRNRRGRGQGKEGRTGGRRGKEWSVGRGQGWGKGKGREYRPTVISIRRVHLECTQFGFCDAARLKQTAEHVAHGRLYTMAHRSTKHVGVFRPRSDYGTWAVANFFPRCKLIYAAILTHTRTQNTDTRNMENPKPLPQVRNPSK